jgi:hypothetical protein
MAEMVPLVGGLARALVETVPMAVVLAVLHSAVVLQTAIPEMYPVVGEEEHGHREMMAPELVVLVLPGKS